MERIDEVLDGLKEVVDDAIASGDRIGYFAALYRQVTIKVDDGIKAGKFFDDNDRMSRFDAKFGNRYFSALDNWRQNKTGVPKTWQDAFDATRRNDLGVVQHLLLGVNAHINRDLAAAAAEVSPGHKIEDLREDFLKINSILKVVLRDIETALGRVSLFTRYIDAALGPLDDEILGFSIVKARDEAWDYAVELAHQSESAKTITLKQLDSNARNLGRLVIDLGGPLNALLSFRTKMPGPSEVIRTLNDAKLDKVLKRAVPV